LKHYPKNFNNVIGIEPSDALKHIKQKRIKLINKFFSYKTSNEYLKKYAKPKIITITNVLAQINNLNEFAKGVHNVISNESLIIIEFPYLLDMINKGLFDLIYHEHLSYFALTPLKFLFRKFGIKIIDVRIKRADLPQANSEAIYKRMQTEREREAKEFRARGAEMAVTITSTADRKVTIILANARKKSEIMKGEGDGKRNKIFASAFGKDPEFFSFYRAMQAYEKALIGGDTSLILSPDSDFFKFFGSSGLIKNQ